MEVRDVYIRSIPIDTTEDDLRIFFYSQGTIRHIKFLPDPNHDGMKCAFVKFNEQTSANNAVMYKNNKDLKGSVVTVSWGRSNQRPNSGYQTNPNVYPPYQNTPIVNPGFQQTQIINPMYQTNNPPLFGPNVKAAKKTNFGGSWKCRDPNCGSLNEKQNPKCYKCQLERSIAEAAVRNRASKPIIHYADSAPSEADTNNALTILNRLGVAEKAEDCVKVDQPATKNQVSEVGHSNKSSADKVNKEVQNLKRDNKELQKQVSYYQKFDFHNQLGKLVRLRNTACKINEVCPTVKVDIPREEIREYLTSVRPLLEIDVTPLESNLKKSLEIYQKTQNLIENAGDDIKAVFQTSLDGAAQGAAITIRDILTSVPFKEVRSSKKNVLALLSSMKKYRAVLVQKDITKQEFEKILEMLKSCDPSPEPVTHKEIASEQIEKLVQGLETTIAILKNPQSAETPLPLLHDLVSEAVRAHEAEVKTNTSAGGSNEKDEPKIMFQFLRRVDHHLQRLCQFQKVLQEKAQTIKERHSSVAPLLEEVLESFNNEDTAATGNEGQNVATAGNDSHFSDADSDL